MARSANVCRERHCCSKIRAVTVTRAASSETSMRFWRWCGSEHDCRIGGGRQLALCLMKKRGAIERQEPATDQHTDPHGQRRAGNDLSPQGGLHIGSRSRQVAEGRCAVKGDHVEPGDSHEQRLEAECVVVEILIGMSKKENDSGHHIEHIGADAPRDEPMNGLEWNAPRETEHAQVKQADRAKQKRETEIVQGLARRPQPRLVGSDKSVQRGAADEGLPWLHWRSSVHSTHAAWHAG